jgi:hypothetical protein
MHEKPHVKGMKPDIHGAGRTKSSGIRQKRAFCLLGMFVSLSMKQGMLGTERNPLVLIGVHEQVFHHLYHSSFTLYVRCYTLLYYKRSLPPPQWHRSSSTSRILSPNVTLRPSPGLVEVVRAPLPQTYIPTDCSIYRIRLSYGFPRRIKLLVCHRVRS